MRKGGFGVVYPCTVLAGCVFSFFLHGQYGLFSRAVFLGYFLKKNAYTLGDFVIPEKFY